MNHAERQTDQIGRRVIGGEKIPHGEKVFSISEEHTEWISKGRAGVGSAGPHSWGMIMMLSGGCWQPRRTRSHEGHAHG